MVTIIKVLSKSYFVRSDSNERYRSILGGFFLQNKYSMALWFQLSHKREISKFESQGICSGLARIWCLKVIKDLRDTVI